MMNTKWNGRFLGVAELVSTWSKDPSTKVGAVLVDPVRQAIVATGFNGFPRGIADTEGRLNDPEFRRANTVHAEINCLLNAASDGISTRHMFLYVHGLPPCLPCALAIIQAGVASVCTRQSIKDVPERWLDSCGKAIDRLNEAMITQYTWEGMNDGIK